MSTDAMIRLVLNGETMGTRYSVIAYADPDMDAPALGRRLHAAISDVESVMSSWRQESDLSRLNHAPVKQWVELPESLMDVLAAALTIEAQSNGAFDIGVGAAVGAWGFGPLAHQPLPDLPASRPITRDALELDRHASRARKQAPLCLDLSGIAKGYGVDRLCDVLTAGGMTRWLVSLDGEVRAGEPKPDGSPWAIGLERPAIGTRDLSGVIEIAEMAAATSGTYRHCRDLNGRTISHTINPATGAPLTGHHASVTVLARTCMEADAWATALLVDGVWPPRGFPRPPGIDAIPLAA